MLKNKMIPIMIILISFSFLQMDCKDEPIKPENNHDTTSHNFSVIRIDTLGSIFSFAHGLDIVDENNIWVAGMFTEQDTNGEILYNKNLAHWNGQKWNLMAVPILGYNNTGPSPQELIAIKVFNDSSMFVISKYNSHARWDGKKWTSYFVDPQISYLHHMWARSANDIYFVGEQGKASHWDGQTFTKINTSITNPPLSDVWGDEHAVYAVGYGGGINEGNETVFLTGNNTNWKVISKYDVRGLDRFDENLVGVMVSVYRQSKNSKLWLLGGIGNARLFELNALSPFVSKKIFDLPNDYHALRIRGTSDNDLYIPSSLNSIFYHYNGVSWYRFDPLINNFLTFDFSVKKKTWVMVGSLRNGVGMATVIIGEHQ